MGDTGGHLDERSGRERSGDGHVGDLATPYALRALEPAEEAWVERHRRLCPPCDRLLGREERFVSLLPFAVQATPPPPPDVKAALLARVAHSQRPRSVAPPDAPTMAAVTIPASRPVPPETAPQVGSPAAALRASSGSGWRTRWATALLVVPLLLMLAGTGAWAAQLRVRADERGDRADGFGQMLERALAGDGTVHQLLPGPAAPEARGWVVTQPGGKLATLFLRNPDASPGQRYQILATRKGPAVALDEVEVDGRGRGMAEFELDLASAEYRQFRLKLVDGDVTGSSATGLALFGRVVEPTAISGGGAAGPPAGEPSRPVGPPSIASPVARTESVGLPAETEPGR